MLAEQLKGLLVQRRRTLQVAPAHRHVPLEYGQEVERAAVLQSRLELPELLEHGRQGYVVALAQYRDHTELGEAECEALLVSRLPVESHALLDQGLRRPKIPLRQGYPGSPVYRSRPPTGSGRVVAPQGGDPTQVPSTLALVRVPEPEQLHRQPWAKYRGVSVGFGILIERPGKRRPEVGVFALHPLVPLNRPRFVHLALRLSRVRPFGELQEVSCVVLSDPLRLPAL
jgi:hypothetical protein